MASLAGKIAWVTGAGTGIGRAGALALAGAGATVILSGRRVEPLQAVAEQIAANGGTAEVAPLDITDAPAAAAVAGDIAAKHRRIDILVNSAGVNSPHRHWHNIDADGWNSVIDINLKGAFNVCHAALQTMRKQRDGLIVNVSSMAAISRTGSFSGFPYGAAKHGLNVLTESINEQNCHLGIRACAFCPGEVATEILDRRPKPPSAEERARMLQEDDTGAAILFIAQLPPHVCVNEIQITPTWNRGYIGSDEFVFPRDD